jgi:hypothetical protein
MVSAIARRKNLSVPRGQIGTRDLPLPETPDGPAEPLDFFDGDEA